MPVLRVMGTDRVIGEIDEDQLQFIVDQLEEEHDQDKDYYIDAATLEMFEEKGCDPELLELLRKALGDEDEMDIEWD